MFDSVNCVAIWLLWDVLIFDLYNISEQQVLFRNRKIIGKSMALNILQQQNNSSQSRAVI